MPRKRERTTTRGSWSVESLNNALKILRQGGKSVYSVSQETGIPYSTLKKRYRSYEANDDLHKRPPKMGRYPVFSEEQENILADHLRELSKKFYGLTRTQFAKTSYTMAQRFGVAERFNATTKTAGKDWLSSFLQRNPGLSIRQPEATSMNRIIGFNKTEVTRFFDNLEAVMTKYHFEAENIYNMDETGMTTVHKTEKIIAPKGQKRVGAVTSWERGKNVTVICAMSASGTFVPPLFIFPRQRHSPHLEKDGPVGAYYTCSHNGWTNENIFILWMRHFIKYVKPTAERPVLLVMDNHNSHSTLEAWELAKENQITMLTIPPHSSHRLQPLDVTFFGPLKKAYNKECDMYIKSKNMVKITPYEIAGLFNKAYTRVASLEKGISGFRVTGIYPINSEIFSDEDFITVQSVCQEEHPSTSNASGNNANDVQPSSDFNEYPSTSGHRLTPESSGNIIDDGPPSSDFTTVLHIVSPIPQPQTSKTDTSKQKQHSEILTTTPMKIVFEAKKKKRVEKDNKAKAIKQKKRDIVTKKIVIKENVQKENALK